jgi:hypothetical protein
MRGGGRLATSGNMRPELQRRLTRLIWRERLRLALKAFVPVSLAVGIVGGGMWVRTHGGPVWILLPVAAAAALGKPAFLLVRYLNKKKSNER